MKQKENNTKGIKEIGFGKIGRKNKPSRPVPIKYIHRKTVTPVLILILTSIIVSSYSLLILPVIFGRNEF
jgi:hypothetical protein